MLSGFVLGLAGWLGWLIQLLAGLLAGWALLAGPCWFSWAGSGWTTEQPTVLLTTGGEKVLLVAWTLADWVVDGCLTDWLHGCNLCLAAWSTGWLIGSLVRLLTVSTVRSCSTGWKVGWPDGA